MTCRVLGDPVSQHNWKGSKVLLYVSSFVKVYRLKPSHSTGNKVQTCEVIDKTCVFSRNEMVITRLRNRNSGPQGGENDQHEISPLNIIAL